MDLLSHPYRLRKIIEPKINKKINTKNEFGQKIKKIRKDRGLTQQEFADSLGYAHNSSLTIMKNGEHYFHTPGQLKFIKKWINEYLS